WHVRALPERLAISAHRLIELTGLLVHQAGIIEHFGGPFAQIDEPHVICQRQVGLGLRPLRPVFEAALKGLYGAAVVLPAQAQVTEAETGFVFLGGALENLLVPSLGL